MLDLKRRDFIALLGRCGRSWRARSTASGCGGSACFCPQSRTIQFQTWIGAFLQALALLGWTIGRNVRIDPRWAGANADAIRRHAAELAALAPDVIIAHGNAPVAALLQATRRVPIVFPVVCDPVAGGLVDSLARPGGNVTGFAQSAAWRCVGCGQP
jgi:hypothetical protein